MHNLKHPDEKKPELTVDEVELLTSPMELTGYKEAIMEAMFKGTKRMEEVWLTPFGLLMDLWECHKQYSGISKSKQELTIDEIIPYGI